MGDSGASSGDGGDGSDGSDGGDGGDGSDGGDGGGGDGSSDGGSGGGDGSSGDGGTDGSSEGGDGEDGASSVDCDADIPPPDTEDACVTAIMECGDTLTSTTARGTTLFDMSEYTNWFCTVGDPDEYGGYERIFEFEHPGTGDVTFFLETPCDELDLFVLRWDYWWSDEECPTEATSLIPTCDADTDRGDGELSVWEDSPSHYLVVVDGPDPVEVNFKLGIRCP
jgi:hypothetical protein